MTSAPVNRVIDASVVDGPGNRTVFFLQGCNYRCLYCHNPETQNLCCGCGRCVAECPQGAIRISDGRTIWDAERCVTCDHCIRICPHHSSPRAVWKTAADCALLAEANRPFIRGITVSGGECTLYPEFLMELFERTQMIGLSNLIDSNGSYPFYDSEYLLENCQGVMLDMKAWGALEYQQVTGAVRPHIPRNVMYLYEAGKLEELRIVVEMNRVDAAAILEGLKDAIPFGARKCIPLRLIAYRPFGVDRAYARQLQAPSESELDALAAMALQMGWEKCFRT